MAHMRKIFDERTKHRLVGIIVVLALMVIFLPAMMRESDKNFDEFPRLRMPKKPPMPKVTLLEPQAMLRSVKASSVDIPKPHVIARADITQAQPISPHVSQEETLEAARVLLKKMAVSERNAMKHNEVFSIQLASFHKAINAQSLIDKLRLQGFSASMQTVKTSQGVAYQVLVGRVKQRDEAIDLQKKLVDNTRLNGLIIKTKVI